MSHIGPPLNAPVDLRGLLQQGLAGSPDAPALVSLEASWSWRELDRDVGRLARSLLRLGLQPGDRVASLLPNRCLTVILYLGCIRAGLVATPLNYRYMAPEIDHALDVSEASVLVAHDERDADVARSAKVQHLPLGRVAYHTDDGGSPLLEAMVADDRPGPALPDTDPARPAFVFFTSGTTGSPKGVTHSVETIGWIAAGTAAALRLTAADTYLVSSSLSHEGAVGMALAALASGAGIAIARRLDADEYLPLLRSTRATATMILPSVLMRLIEDPAAAHDDFASLRYCTTAGDKLPMELAREFEEKTGFGIHEHYGMTEFGLGTATPPDGPIKTGSVGPLAPGFRAEIRDDAGNVLPAGRAGRLWMKSPAIMTGYWNRPDATADVLVHGWLDTGDVMSIDADGYLWFAGRSKQIIVHDGSNIAPQEVEDALLAHPAVAGAGVVGIHDRRHGENVRAFVTLHPGTTAPSANELIAFARVRVGYKAPEEIVLLDELPLNATGKLDRAGLKAMAEAPPGESTAST